MEGRGRKRTSSAGEGDSTGGQREGLRKAPRQCSSIQCPVCDVTLNMGTIQDHVKVETERLAHPQTHSRRRPTQRASSSSCLGSSAQQDSSASTKPSIIDQARQTLEAVRRRTFLFEHPLEQPGPSGGAGSSCCVCGVGLPSDPQLAAEHVSACVAEQDGGSDNDSEYEEYTWCNVTRVRATSMMDARTRAAMFNGTVVSMATEQEGELDVEEDQTTLYGPAQYSESDIYVAPTESQTAKGESPAPNEAEIEFQSCDQHTDRPPLQCLICMDAYTNPLVSIQCWHVYCEQCWLKALATQKLCPKCKTITCADDLRKVYL